MFKWAILVAEVYNFLQGLIWFKLLTVDILGVPFFSVLPVLIIMKDFGGREQDIELT